MQGRQVLQQSLFVQVNLEEFIPKDHRLRKIDKILDLSFVYELTRNLYTPGNGRPSIDPAVFFKMQIIKYLYNIQSDRQLCEDIHVNLAYRWFLRFSVEDKTPDHSALTKIRKRLGEEVFEAVFQRILSHCKKVGLVTGKQIVTDGTLIEADAASESLVRRKSEDQTPDAPETKKKTSIATHVSTTDPDATMVGRPGIKKRLYYKAHISVEGSSRVITDCHVTTGAQHECTVFQDRVEHQISKLGLEPEEWLADAGYGHGPAYEFLQGKKITPYIPLRDPKLGRGKHAPDKGFRYNRKENTYTCPAGHPMYPHKPTSGLTRYVIRGGLCQTCPMKEFCFRKNGEPSANKRIHRADYQDHYDRLHRRMPTAHFKKKLRERSWKIEGINALLKDNHGLRRAHYRGRSNVQIQVYLIATVFNLKCMTKARRGWFFVAIWPSNYTLNAIFINFDSWEISNTISDRKLAA